MGQIRVPRDETEVPLTLTLTREGTGPEAGATVVVAIRDGDTDDSYFDFNDETFKTGGHTTLQAALTESATIPGEYILSGGFDLAAAVGNGLPSTTDHLVVTYEVTAPADMAGIASDIILIDDRVEDGVAVETDGITAASIATAAIDADAIASAAFTNSKFGGGAITASVIASGAINNTKFATGAITAAVVAADAIGASELATDAVSEIVDAVWNRALTSHRTAGTTGRRLGDLGFVNGFVYLSSIGSSGTAFPLGTINNPVNNFADAVSISNTNGLRRIFVQATSATPISVDTSIISQEIVGENPLQPISLTTGAIIDGASFSNLTVRGDGQTNASLKARFINCLIDQGLSGVRADFIRCRFAGTTTIPRGALISSMNIVDCRSIDAGAGTVLVFSGSGSVGLSLRGWIGNLEIQGIDDASDDLCLDVLSGVTTLDSTVTAGSVGIRGGGWLIDNSAGATVVDLRTSAIAWDEQREDHEVAGSTGEALRDLREGLVLATVTLSGTPTTTSAESDATAPNDYFNDALLVVETSSGFSAARITDYANLNGTFTYDPLDEAPTAGTTAFVVSAMHFQWLNTLATASLVTAVGTSILSDTGDILTDTASLLTLAAEANEENLRTQVFTAVSEIASGQNSRFVPENAISHVFVEVKADAAADWSAPVDSYYVVFNYFSGATSDDRSAAAATQAAAPVDGTFSSVPAPV